MEILENRSLWNRIRSSSFFAKNDSAFQLIRQGKEQEARTEFPAEYHFIKKYRPSSVDELADLLSTRLEIR